MSMLTVVQHFCRRENIPVPSTAAGSTDTQVKQVVALLEEEGNDLKTRGPWQALTFEATHTTVATESQGAIATIASNGFRKIKNDTIWDRTSRVPVMGPLNAQAWQDRQALTSTGPRAEFRIRGGLLLVTPAPTAGLSWAFEYMSENWILGADGTTYSDYFTLDTDTILLPERLVLMGLRWRWKKEKGFEYSEDFRTYEAQVAEQLGGDGGKPVLYMDGTSSRRIPPDAYVI